MTAPTATGALTADAIRTFAEDWYKALDVHAPIEEVLPLMVDDGLEMVFPEATARGHEGFRAWYEAVTHRFFDEVHTVTKVEPVITGDTATVDVVVNWQAKIWDAPAPKSAWLGFDARQTWEVKAGPEGQVLLTRYVVDGLDPMPGSASL